MRRLGRTGALLCVVVVVSAITACTPSNRPLREVSTDVVTSTGHTPVLIVPGWALECRQGPAKEWKTWTDAFVASGWSKDEVDVLDYDACAPATKTAELVGHAVYALRER